MADKSEAALDGKALHSLRVVDLRSALEKRGLPKSGSKKELVERLKLQLKIEKLHEESVKAEDRVPNLDLQDELTGQNDFVRQYLAAQQQTYAMQLKERRLAEMQAFSSAPDQVGGEEAAAVPVVLSPAVDEKSSHQGSWERPRRGRTCPSSIDPGGNASHCPYQGKLPVGANTAVDTCRRSRLRQKRLSPPCPAKKGRTKSAGGGEQEQSCQPQPEFSSTQNECSMHDMVQRTVQSPRKGAVAPAVSPPPIDERKDHRYPSRRKREKSVSEEMVTASQPGCTEAITNDEKEACDVEACQATPASHQDKTAEKSECVREKHARLEDPSPALVTAHRSTRKKNKRKSLTTMGTNAESSPLELSQQTLPQHLPEADQSNIERTSYPIQCSVVDGSKKRGKPLRMLITRTGTTKSVISCNRVNMRCEPLPENAAACHLNTSSTQVPCNVLPSEPALNSSALKDSQPDTQDTQSPSRLLEVQVGDDLHETLNKLHITEAESRKKTTETDSAKESLSSVQCDTIPVCATPERSAPSLVEQERKEDLNKDSVTRNCDANTVENTPSENKNFQPAAAAIVKDVEQKALEQDLNASSTSPAEHNTPSTSSMAAGASSSPTRPSVRRPLTLEEMTSAVESILQTTEQTLALNEQCQDMPDTHANLIDEKELDNATDSLLKEMSVHNEENLQLTTSCLSAQQDKIDEFSTSTTLHKNYIPSDDKRGCGTEEVSVKCATESPYNIVLSQSEPAMFETQSSISQNEELICTTILPTDATGILSGASLTEGKVLDEGAQPSTPNSSSSPQCFDAVGLDTIVTETKPCTTVENDKHQQKISQQSTSTAISTSPPTECLEDMDTQRPDEHTRSTITEASKNDSTREPLNSEPSQLLNSKIPVQVLENDQSIKTDHVVQEMGDKSSLQETSFYQETFQPLHKTQAKDDGQKALASHKSSGCLHSACEDKDVPGSLECVPPLETTLKQSAGVELCSNLTSLDILDDTQKLHADVSEKGASPEKQLNTPDFSLSETTLETISCSGDKASKSADTVETSLPEVEPCKEQRIINTLEVLPCSRGSDNTSMIKSRSGTLYTTEHEESKKMDTSGFLPKLLSSNSEESADNSKQLDLSSTSLGADTPVMLSSNRDAGMQQESDNRCSSYFLEEQSIRGSGSNEGLQNEGTKTKATAGALSTVPNEEKEPAEETTTDSLKTQECTENTMHEINEKAAVVTGDAGCTISNNGNTDEPPERKKDVLHFPQDEVPQEMSVQCYTSPVDEPGDKDTMSTYTTNQDSNLTSCILPMPQDRYNSEALPDFSLEEATSVNLDNSNDAMNPRVSDSSVTSSVPLSVASESSSGSLAKAHKQNEEAQAVSTVPCSLGAGFTVTQQQHQQHQDASSLRSCDSTTESCNALQHSPALSVKECAARCPDANSAISLSAKGQCYDGSVLAPESTIVECGMLHHSSSPNTPNVMGPVQPNSSTGIQDTKEMPAFIIPCSNTHKPSAICQFSRPHENDDIPSKPMQGDQQMQATHDGRAARKEVKNDTSVSGEIMDSSDAMKSRSPVGCACDDLNPAERKLENKDNFDNSGVSPACSEEANLAITGELFVTTAETKADIKNAAAEHKQSATTTHEVSSELENTDKIEVTDCTCTKSPAKILLQEHESLDERKNEALATNTQMIILHSNRANATREELLLDKNDTFQKEKCSTHNNQYKQEVGANLHLCGTSPKHPPSAMSVIINAHVVHEASAASRDFSEESTNISFPEHSEELGTDAIHEREPVEEFESFKFGGLHDVGIEEHSNNTLNVTGSTNISVKARNTIHKGAETSCDPHSSTLRNENSPEHSNLSSVVPEDGIRSQNVETTVTSAIMEQANVKGNDDSSAFYSPSEACFTGLNATPEPSNIEPTLTGHKEMYAKRTGSEFAHSPTDLSRSTTQVEYSTAAHAVSHISGAERTVNLADMDTSDSDQAVEKHTLSFSTNAEHLSRPVEIVNSSSNFAVKDELVLGFTAGNLQHCAPLLVEDIPKDLEGQDKEHTFSSPSNCAKGNDNSAIYDSKGTKEDSMQMEATMCTEQHGADLIRSPGADGMDIDVATGSMEFPSCSKSHADTAASNSCGAHSFNIAASPKRNVEWQCSVSCTNSQLHEACDPLPQNCGKSDASAGLQDKTRETGRNVLGRVDTSDSSEDTSCSESEEHEMARLRGRGVRKQVPARATKESSEASSDGEGSEAGNRRLRNGRRATPEEPQAMRRSSRNRKAATEESPKEDSDAATEPESTPGSPQLEEGQVLSPVNEEEEQKPVGKKASEGSSSSSSSESSDTSDGEEEPVGRRGLKGVLASPPGRHQAPSEGPRSPPNSEPAQEEDVKSQEEPAEVKTVEPDQRPLQEERPAKESVPEDVEMKDDDESQPASGASPPKFKTRRLSTAALKKDSEDKEERPQRKRRWGSTNVVLGPSVSISTAALKDLIPDIEEPLSKPKELEEEHVTASVGESPVTEQEEASDEPPAKLKVVDDEPTSEEMPPCSDNTEKDQEKGEDGEPSHGEKSTKGDRIDKASRDEKPNDDRLPRSERFSRDEKEKHSGRDEKTNKAEKPPREVSRDDKHGRHEASTKETKGARERVSPITAPTAERKALHVISDRAPLSKRPAAGKDEAGQRKLASPPRNPKSRILFVRNLVRPFTLNQLKQLLQEFGDTVDSEFWIDKIKSKCFVTYVSEEDAVKAREALHNLRWPLCNPKILHVDFSSPEEMERQKEPPTPPPPRPVAVTERTVPAFQRTVEVDTRMPTGREVLRDPREVLRDPREPREIKDPREPKDPREARGTVSGPPARPDRNLMAERQAVNRRPALPVREWDRDKLRQETPPPPPAERAPAQSRNRATSPPDKRERRDKKVAKRKSEEDTPAKLLDDLFRKTKASPCIYWLPLTEEQIARKEEERKQRRQERERRRQQQQLQEEEERRKRALARDMAAKTKQESKRSGSRSPVRRR
ncbi:uncharacterized protein LOC119372300 isoform X1 [Rhipicephalus sanguineus]|nr:uncharacterized protein LOC119372300 isoform X1 [Rhipicephalus sanguineus]